MKTINVWFDVIEKTPVGRVIVAATDEGVCRVDLGAGTISEFKKSMREDFGDVNVQRDANKMSRYLKEIIAYFSGKLKDFTIPVDLSGTPGFYKKVLMGCASIPYGTSLSYGELAAKVGNPKASRAWSH